MSATREAWLHPEGASYQTLSALRATVDGLPESYLALLTRGNGGETSLVVPPFNFCLDSAEAALDYWRSGTYTLPGVFVFGGNGGWRVARSRYAARPAVAYRILRPNRSRRKYRNGRCRFRFISWCSRHTMKPDISVNMDRCKRRFTPLAPAGCVNR